MATAYWYWSCYGDDVSRSGPSPALRQNLGEFLRSRRERLTPGAAGLPGGARRRTPGLRREEVAFLAGIGITWYTWLEQGREVHPSADALSAVANALRLDATERRHLFTLAGRPSPESPSALEPIDAPLHRMLESLTEQPAYITGRRWDVLAWNRGAEAVFGEYGALQGDERNIMHLVFANERHRRLLVDWEPLARTVLATFRADCARYAGDPDFERLIRLLQDASREFRAWWPKHEVLQPLSGQKRILHPTAGHMSFEYTSFSVIGRADLKLVLYTPMEERTAGKLQGLLRARHPQISAAPAEQDLPNA